jgi:hypothetical protein
MTSLSWLFEIKLGQLGVSPLKELSEPVIWLSRMVPWDISLTPIWSGSFYLSGICHLLMYMVNLGGTAEVFVPKQFLLRDFFEVNSFMSTIGKYHNLLSAMVKLLSKRRNEKWNAY